MSEFKQQLGKMSRQKRLYNLETLPRHLVESAEWERLYQLLTNFDFIEAKLDEWGVQALIEDYDLPLNSNMWLSQEQSETLKLIPGAIRKSAHILEKDKRQLPGQLLGRLLNFEIAELQRMLEQVKQWKDSPWLRPLMANLWPPGQGCVRILTGHSFWVLGVAIAPDGKTAISASSDKTLKIWDTETGRQLQTLTGHTKPVLGVAIAPDGKQAISASWDTTLKIWDTETGRELRTLTGHTREVLAVAIATDGRTAISASRDRTLKIWDTNSGRELRTLTGHSGGVNAVAIAPSGLIAVSGSSDRTLKIWDLLSGKEIGSFSGDDVFDCCAIAPDGVTVVAGDRGRQVHFLRLEGVISISE